MYKRQVLYRITPSYLAVGVVLYRITPSYLAVGVHYQKAAVRTILVKPCTYAKVDVRL